MKSITQFIESYLNIKIKNYLLKFIIKFFILFLLYIILLILFEKYTFLYPYSKIKIFNSTYVIIISIVFYLVLKIIIHKRNIFNNSNKQQLAKELINKISSKDRIINALQIYSKLDFKDPYSDLTIKAIEDTEKELNEVNLKKKDYPFNLIYILIITIIVFVSLIFFSNNNYQATVRLISKNTFFEKPLPFKLQFKLDDLITFKGEDYTINILGTNSMPKKITLFWENNNEIFSRVITQINNTYSYKFKNLNSNIKVWAEYKNNAILPHKKYTINSDTINISPKTRPKIKNLTINITPPPYTKLDEFQHKSTLTKINVLKGSIIRFKGEANKKIIASYLIADKDTINMKIKNNIITSEIEVSKSDNILIVCYDKENNASLKIKYFINAINDMNPTVNIKSPKNNIKIDENYLIELSGDIIDDFGINKAILEYYILKPYYLDQDTTLNNNIIIESNNNTIEYFKYKWDLANLNISPGDELIYWVTAYDNNTLNGPGIGSSSVFKALFPSLEELFLEVENEQDNIFETFDDMDESMEELKNMYNEISNDILKEEIGWEQEKESNQMANELEKISNKIDNLEATIEKIEELNQNNNLINEQLSDKIETLQKMFQNIMTPELIKAIEELQKSINENDFNKSLEKLKNFEFEMEDLEKQLDRMIELFEKVVAEQKLDELIKKINNMENLQKDISSEIEKQKNNSNIKSMENKQIKNTDDIFKTMQDAELLIENNNNKISDSLNKLRNSSTSKKLQTEIKNISNVDNKKEVSNNIENHINNIKNELEKIISEYNKNLAIEILNMYTRIIKNLIDMSYEQEIINNITKPIKYKSNLNIKDIANKENIILYQYKNLFVQISNLANKSFHMKPEVSKMFGQIFNYLIKTINNFEQGNINDAKNNQKLVLEYINKSIILLLQAMSEMQSSNSYSGYDEYLQKMQQLGQGQQLMNQGMQSLLPMPFGQPGQNGLMQSLIEQQQKLMQELKELMEKNGNPGGGGQEGEGDLGKALQEMEEIIKDLENNIINEETFDKGERIYNKLLNHQKANKEKGMDELWKTEDINNNELIKNNIMNNLKTKKNIEIKELYETLNNLNQNKNITNENKKIIKQYIKILIDEKTKEQNDEK